MLGLVDPQPDPDGEQVPLREHVLARVLDRPDHHDPDGAALGQQQRRGRSRSASCMVRSLIHAVSAASSSTSTTISGSAVVGVWRRVTPQQPVLRVRRITCDGVLEQLREARLRSRRRLLALP